MEIINEKYFCDDVAAGYPLTTLLEHVLIE